MTIQEALTELELDTLTTLTPLTIENMEDYADDRVELLEWISGLDKSIIVADISDDVYEYDMNFYECESKQHLFTIITHGYKVIAYGYTD